MMGMTRMTNLVLVLSLIKDWGKVQKHGSASDEEMDIDRERESVGG